MTAHEPHSDETHNLLLAGLRRARITGELPPLRPFCEAHVDLLTEFATEDSAAISRPREPLARRLWALMASRASAVGMLLPADLPRRRRKTFGAASDAGLGKQSQLERYVQRQMKRENVLRRRCGRRLAGILTTTCRNSA